MNMKFLARERLAKTVADDVAAVCPAGEIGLDFADVETRRAVQRELVQKGLSNRYGEGAFPEHVRAVAAGGAAERFDFARFGIRALFLAPDTLPAELFLDENADKIRALYFAKEDLERREPSLAVSGVKTLLLFYLSAVDRAVVSIADVSGEDEGAFRFLADANEFFAEPPQKQNYLARLLNLLNDGSALFRPPFTRFAALARGADASGFQELLFLVSLLKKSAELPFLRLLTLGRARAEELYFLEECKEEVVSRAFGEDGAGRIARHARLLTGCYELPDAELEAMFSTVSAAVRADDGGFLSALKREGVLEGFVKYPL